MQLTTNKKGLSHNIYITLLLRLGLVMVLFSLSRIAFYYANLVAYPDITLARFLYIMWGGIRFDLSAILYTNLLFILLQIIPFDFRYSNKYQNVSGFLFLITNTIIIIANTADIAYYPYTLKRTTSAVFQQFANEENLGKLFSRFLVDFWEITLIGLLFIFLLVFFFKKIKIGKRPEGRFKIRLLKNSLLFVVLGLLTVIGLRGGYTNSSRPITLSNASKYITLPSERAIVLNTPFAVYRTLGKKTFTKVQYFTEIEQKSIYSARYHSNTKGTFKKKNVVILILESFGREHIGALNKDIPGYRGFTPFIDSLIGVSYTFKKSYANGRKSISAMPSVIASIPSLVEPFILAHYSGDAFNSLASILTQQGYSSAFFHGAPNGSMGFDAFARQAGFQQYFGKDEYDNDDDFDGYWGIWDDKFFHFFAQKMKQMNEPFYTTLFSLSSHHPYIVPEEFEGKFPEGKLPIQKTIGYTDYALRHFFTIASKMPWFNNTVFVLTADHAATFSDLPEYLTFQGYFAVPIIIYSPGDSLVGFNDSTVVQQIDIMPTVLNYLGYDHDFIAFGNDMFNPDTAHFTVNYYSDVYQIIEGETILQFDGEKTIGLYDLKKDRLNKKNLVGLGFPIENKLLTKLKAFIQEYNRRLIDNDLEP